MIHVCSLAGLHDTVAATGASHVVTLLANVDRVQRPESVLRGQPSHRSAWTTSPSRWTASSRPPRSMSSRLIDFRARLGPRARRW